MNVLIIPEDFRNDQYILKPLFSRLFQSIVKRRVHVDVCRDPLLGGVGEALKSERIAEGHRKTRRHDGYLHPVHRRDGEKGRRQRLDQIEAEFGDVRVFLAENAWEEIETWLLAGLDLPANWNWRTVRAEVQVKEIYFGPLASQRGLSERARRWSKAPGRRGVPPD